MNNAPEYLSISELAKVLSISTEYARQLAKSKRLRNIRGAVIDVNMSGGKYQCLRVNINAVKKVFDVVG